MFFNKIKKPIKILIKIAVICLVAFGTFFLSVKYAPKPDRNYFIPEELVLAEDPSIPISQIFDLSFPAEPVPSQVTLNARGKPLTFNEYTATDVDGTQYSFSYLTIPGKFKIFGNKTILKYSLDTLLKSDANLTLIESSVETYKSLPAIKFKLSSEGKEINGFLIIAKNRLIKLTVTPPAETPTPENANKFFNSFSLKN